MTAAQGKKKIVIKKRPKSAVKRTSKKPIRKIKRTGRPEKDDAPTPEEQTAPVVEAEPVMEAEPLAEAEMLAPPEPVEEPDEVADRFAFYCPYCAAENEVGHSEVGVDVSCQSCGNTITVPPPLAEPPVVAAKKAPSRAMFKFYCSICGLI